ncbi:hypothetical protein diail_417 [Diaporthe ilicicola]|nr:hypothetical protein diail_417 [Diaporthe ilicicola]
MKHMSSDERRLTANWLHDFWMFSFVTTKYWGKGPKDWTLPLINAKNVRLAAFVVTLLSFSIVVDVLRDTLTPSNVLMIVGSMFSASTGTNVDTVNTLSLHQVHLPSSASGKASHLQAVDQVIEPYPERTPPGRGKGV